MEEAGLGDITQCKVTVQNCSNDLFSPNFHSVCIFHGEDTIVYSKTLLHPRCVCVCKRKTERVGSGERERVYFKTASLSRGETWHSFSSIYRALTLFQALSLVLGI